MLWRTQSQNRMIPLTQLAFFLLLVLTEVGFITCFVESFDQCKGLTVDKSLNSSLVIVTSLNTPRLSALQDSVVPAIEEICKSAGTCCTIEPVRPIERDAPSVPAGFRSIHSVQARDVSGDAIHFVLLIPEAEEVRWLTLGDPKNLEFLRTCVTNVELNPLAWRPCVEAAKWSAKLCDQLLANSWSHAFVDGHEVDHCKLLELADDPKMTLKAWTKLQAAPAADMATLRYLVSVVGWRHWWLNSIVGSWYKMLRINAGDFIQSPHAAMGIMMEHMGLYVQDKTTLQKAGNSVKQSIEGAADLNFELTEDVDRLLIELLPIKASFMPSDWPPMNLLASVASNSTIYMSQVNCGYLDFADNWIASIQRLGADNYILLAEDKVAYSYLNTTYGYQHVLMVPDGANRRAAGPMEGALDYSSPAFNLLTEKRPFLLEAIIKKGFNVMWMDIDTFVIESPIDHVPEFASIAFQHDNTRSFCMCMIIMKPSAFAVWVLQEWERGYDMARMDGAKRPHDQHVFRMYVTKPRDAKQRLDTTQFYVLPKDKFPSGKFRFDTKVWADAFNNAKPAWIHANYMKGHQTKKDTMLAHDYWIIESKEYPQCG